MSARTATHRTDGEQVSDAEEGERPAVELRPAVGVRGELSMTAGASKGGSGRALGSGSAAIGSARMRNRASEQAGRTRRRYSTVNRTTTAESRPKSTRVKPTFVCTPGSVDRTVRTALEGRSRPRSRVSTAVRCETDRRWIPGGRDAREDNQGRHAPVDGQRVRGRRRALHQQKDPPLPVAPHRARDVERVVLHAEAMEHGVRPPANVGVVAVVVPASSGGSGGLCCQRARDSQQGGKVSSSSSSVDG